MKKASTQVIESIHRLNSKSPEWLKVVEMLQEDRDLLLSQLVNEDDEVQTRRYQGMLQYLERILKYQSEAQTILRKRKEIT